MLLLRAALRAGILLLATDFALGQSGETAQEAYARAVASHQAGNFDGAIREYRAALALDPANFQARSNLGVALAHVGQYEEAIASYRKALETAPEAAAVSLRLNLALAYYKSGQIPEAARGFEEIRQRIPSDLQVTLLTADCYLRLGELQRVIDLLAPIAPSHPDDRAVAYMLGMALIRSGQPERGQVLVNSLLDDHDSAEAHFLIGSVVFMAKDYPKAVEEFSRAIAANPDLPSLQSYYGQALLFTGDVDGAAAAFRKQLASDPNDYESNLRLAQILAKRRQYVDARPLLERALRLRSGSAEADFGLAQLDLDERQFDRARQRLERIVAGSPRYADAHRALAAADEQLGRTQQAARERALSVQLEAGSGGLPLGSPAPDFALLSATGDQRIRLSDFRGKRPVVVVFGSYTCPKFRSQSDELNSLYERYRDRAEFLLVYIREAHGTESWQSSVNKREGIDLSEPTSFEQRREYASSCLRKLKIKYLAAVDPLENTTEKAYSAWPSRVYLIDKRGLVTFNSLLDELNFAAVSLESAIQAALAK